MNIKNAPLVSVCIPTFNRAGCLEKAITSAQKSDFPNLEIIVSDNASNDSTEELCRQKAKSDVRIRYFRHPKNLGPTANFEFARTQAKGKYFLWLGDDDCLTEKYIGACVNRLESDEGLILVSGNAAYHLGDNRITHYGIFYVLNSSAALFRVLKYFFLVGDNAIFYGVYRKSQVGGSSIPDCLAGDWIWIAKALLRGRALMMQDVIVKREYGNNSAISPANIVAMLGAPKWHGRFPLLATALNATKYLLQDRRQNNANPLWTYGVLLPSIAAVFWLKAVASFLRVWVPKIPIAKKIYYKLRK